jgi:hypothetical protein
MKMLLSVLLVPLMAAPAVAQGADTPVFKPGAEFIRTLNAVNRIPDGTGLLAPGGTHVHVAGARVPKGSRANQVIASARAKGSAAPLPSFAIKGGGDSLQASNGSAQSGPSKPANGAASSQPPVSFSFAASGQSESRTNRYQGGIYMAAPF